MGLIISGLAMVQPGGGLLHVFHQNAAVATTAADRGQVDAALLRQPPGGRIDRRLRCR
jgi:hypothetical protein